MGNHTRSPSTPPGTPVKPNALTVAPLLSIVLLPSHTAGEVVLGLDRGGSGLLFVVVPILLVVACGTLLLAERRSGHVIMFLGGLAALAMPVITTEDSSASPSSRPELASR